MSSPGKVHTTITVSPDVLAELKRLHINISGIFDTWATEYLQKQGKTIEKRQSSVKLTPLLLPEGEEFQTLLGDIQKNRFAKQFAAMRASIKDMRRRYAISWIELKRRIDGKN